MPRLRANERCPLHRGSKVCCGRGQIAIQSKRQSRQYALVGNGTRRYPDGREVCPPAELKRRKDALLRDYPWCRACMQKFEDYRDAELAHIEPKGMGGWKRDDRVGNLSLLHRITNLACGSRNLDEYINDIRKAGKKFPCEVR